MMTENIIVAIITGLFDIAGVVISNYATNKKMTIEQARRDKRIEGHGEILKSYEEV